MLFQSMLQTGASMNDIWFQAGMVGAFMVFSIALITIFIRHIGAKNKSIAESEIEREKSGREEREQRDRDWREFLMSRDQSFIGAIKERDEHWRQLAEVEVQRRSETMTMAMDHLDALTQDIRNLTTTMANHDLNAQVRSDRIMVAIEAINGEDA